MLHKKDYPPSLARRTAALVILILSLAVSALAQDPSGRPTDPKGKKPTKKPTSPTAPTITLTVLTNPPESTVYMNGEKRGVTNAEGKIQFEKLPLGHYSIEVRKDGYGPMLRGFEAGSESPTLVFKLDAKLDDYVAEFNSLMAAGKLTGPETPNALAVIEKV